MTTTSDRSASAPQPGQPMWRLFLGWPKTKLGWWSVGLTAAFVVMMLFNGAVLMQRTESVQGWLQWVLILYGWVMLACGLGSGITALIALLRRGERSALTWLPILAGLFVLVLVLGEFLGPPH